MWTLRYAGDNKLFTTIFPIKRIHLIQKLSFVVLFLHLYNCIRIIVLNCMMLSNHPCNYNNCFLLPRISPKHEGFSLQYPKSQNDLSAKRAINTYVCVANVVHSLIIMFCFYLISFSVMASKNIIADLNKGDKLDANNYEQDHDLLVR